MRRFSHPTHAMALAGLLAIFAMAAAAEDQVVVTISKADCDRLVEHRPAPDVAYQPGVDVNGQPVVPADLNGGIQIAVPETIRIPITVDLFNRFGIPANPDSFEAEAEVGVVTYRDGRATFNGQPLQDDAAAELSVLCQTAARENR
ncbi:MAG TPA: hypothetical protein VGA60_12680 [Kiloniellales bacterium]